MYLKFRIFNVYLLLLAQASFGNSLITLYHMQEQGPFRNSVQNKAIMLKNQNNNIRTALTNDWPQGQA